MVTAGWTHPSGWDTELFGNGIIDAQKVLQADLPPVTFAVQAAMAQPQARFDQLKNLFDDVPRAALRRELSRLQNVSEPALPRMLEEVGDELTFHFFSDARAREDFRKRCKSPASLRTRARPLGYCRSLKSRPRGPAREWP